MSEDGQDRTRKPARIVKREVLCPGCMVTLDLPPWQNIAKCPVCGKKFLTGFNSSER